MSSKADIIAKKIKNMNFKDKLIAEVISLAFMARCARQNGFRIGVYQCLTY